MTEAPRWRLTNPHYLKVFELPDGTRCEWEHKETARETGRTVRKLFPVPILLNPSDPNDQNYRETGECIVANEVEGASNLQRDIIFEGKPTPEMEPLNDAAQAISDSMRAKWDHPIDSLPVNGGMTPQESVFMQQMMEAFARAAPPPAQPTAITQAQFDELKGQIATLQAALATKAGPMSPIPERRV